MGRGTRCRDFDDGNVDTAAQLAPILLLLDRLHSVPSVLSRPSQRSEQLTPREQEIIQLLTTGMTARAIGSLIGISTRTVREHLENAYRKLGTHDRLLVALDSHPTQTRPAISRTTLG